MKKNISIVSPQILFYLFLVLPFWGLAQLPDKNSDVLMRIKVESPANARSTGDTIWIKAYENLVQIYKRVVPVDKKDLVVKVPKAMVGKPAVISYVFDKKGTEGKRDVFALRVIMEDSLMVAMNTATMQSDIRFGMQTQALEKFAAQTKGLDERTIFIKRLKEQNAIDSLVLKKELLKISTELQELKARFISDNPHSFKALFVLRELVRKYLSERWSQDTMGIELREYKRQFLSLSNDVQQKGQDVLMLLQNAETRTVAYFTGEMPNGKIFDLKSLKGKVVLIDFWGSWCIPCRQGHPHLKELYAKYKDKGFEIIGIGWEKSDSKDRQLAKLRKAITDDGLPWPQILHQKEKRDLVSEYGVTGFPTKFLVDRNGKLLFRIGTDPERLLDAKLRELFQ